jgi:hypothetical protein
VPGRKSVTLKVCAAVPNGRCSSVTKQLTVLDPLPAVLAVAADPPEPYVGDRLRLTATAAGKPPFSWLWNLPGGATSRTNPAIVETARLAPGLLTFRVRVSNPSGAGSRTVYLPLRNPKPALTGLTLSTTTPAVGTVLHASPSLTGRPPLTFRWTFDGALIGSDPTLTWQVPEATAGPHALALRVSNAYGAASLTRTLTVQRRLILDFHPLCPELLCLFAVNTPVTFDLTLDPLAHPLRFDYDWLGNGPFTDSSPVPIASHVYSQPGNYRPRVRVITALSSEIRLASQFLLVTR